VTESAHGSFLASPVVPPPSAAASAGVGLVTAAAAAAARDEVVVAAYDGAAGVFCGCCAARGVWRLGGMMAEMCFNDLTARVGVATVATAINSVTATVIDLYVHWKPGFVLNLEASLSSSLSMVRDGDKLGSDDSITRYQFKESTTWHCWNRCWTAMCANCFVRPSHNTNIPTT